MVKEQKKKKIKILANIFIFFIVSLLFFFFDIDKFDKFIRIIDESFFFLILIIDFD